MNKIYNYVKITIVVLIVLITQGIVGSVETHYTKNAEIIGRCEDEFYVEDTSGEQFAFYGDGFKKGDKVKVTFFDCGTVTRQDDEIVKVKLLKE